jgi:hypothetical protein
MMWLKACPRCAGDLLRQSDFYGSYVSCLQCGYILRPEEELPLTSALATVRVEARISPS